MKKMLATVVLALVAVPVVQAGDSGVFAGGISGNRPPTARTVVIDPRSGIAVPAVTRLHPVVGSVQRTSHFANPFTHKAKYSSVNYNPVLGSFSTQKFRR